MYVSMRRCDFVLKVNKMDVWKSKIVWSGKNECHMFHEIAIKFWVA